jgi:ABC transporter with metal-binding/Fe-S-binding domain ATP-binding protein
MSAWASLFSGGKDSSYALYLAMESGREVARLVTVHPPADSFMYHVPATRLASLAAESVGVPLVEVEVGEDRSMGSASEVVDSGARGDREVEPLEAALADLADEVDLAGVTAGAVESEYQTDRLRAMAERLGVDLYAPLWRRDARELAEGMLEAGFEIRIVQVAAEGLDESWLGRTLDREALAELERLNERHGVHLLGEGGEYETLVVDGPHMDRRIELEYDVVWAGNRGGLEIRDAWLD